jgi:hypothetical protein
VNREIVPAEDGVDSGDEEWVERLPLAVGSSAVQ